MIDLSEDFETPDMVKIPFGKYAGETVQEVWETNPRYLKWFYWETNGNDHIKNQIRNAFESAGEDL